MNTQSINKIIRKSRKGFIKVPYWLLTRKDISDAAFRTLICILSFQIGNNAAFPGEAKLAIMRGKCAKAIRNHIKELRDKKIITTERRGFAKTYLYKLIEETNCRNGEKAAEESFPSKWQDSTDQSGNIVPLNKSESNNMQTNNSGKTENAHWEQLRKTVDKFRPIK